MHKATVGSRKRKEEKKRTKWRKERSGVRGDKKESCRWRGKGRRTKGRTKNCTKDRVKHKGQRKQEAKKRNREENGRGTGGWGETRGGEVAKG